jgi:hypothetical protein
VLGEFHAAGAMVYGDTVTTRMTGCYIDGGYWTSQRGDTAAFMTGLNGCLFTGASIIFSDFGDGNARSRMATANRCTFTGCSFENDATLYAANINLMTHGCRDTQYGTMGFQRNDLSLWCDSVGEFALTGDTTDYNLSTLTAECWVKLQDGVSGGIGGILSHVLPGGGTRAGINIYYVAASKTLFASVNHASNGTLNYVFADLFDHTTGPDLDGWHHLAITLAGGVMKLWVNGTVVATSAGGMVAPSGSRQFMIGAFGDSPFSPYPLHGLIANVTISNVDRMTGAGTPPRRRFGDANTVGLWGSSTNDPIAGGGGVIRGIWTDMTGAHDALLDLGTPPLFVARRYPLP